MNSAFDDLDTEIDTLSKQCKESAVHRLAPETKEKIQDLSKQIDTKLNDTSIYLFI